MKHYITLFLLLLVFSGTSVASLTGPEILSGPVCAEEDDKDTGDDTEPSDDDEEPDCD